MVLDIEKFPKHYDADPELWENEGEWRHFMVCIYTMKRIE